MGSEELRVLGISGTVSNVTGNLDGDGINLGKKYS